MRFKVGGSAWVPCEFGGIVQNTFDLVKGLKTKAKETRSQFMLHYESANDQSFYLTNRIKSG